MSAVSNQSNLQCTEKFQRGSTAMKLVLSGNEVRDRIYLIRGSQVMLDSDLAQLYEVETKALKRAVRRNIERFPADFMFELTKTEHETLRCQIGTSKVDNLVENSETRGGDRFSPFVFTEPGVAMLSSVLRSDRAIQINIAIMRTFIQLRKQSEKQIGLVQKIAHLENRFDELSLRFDKFESGFQKQVEVSCSKGQLVVEIPSNESGPPPVLADPSEVAKVKEIQNVVVRYWGLRIEDLKSSSRTREVALPRQIAIYLSRSHTRMGFRELGKHFGGRDHSTILYAYRKICIGIEKNKVMRESVLSVQNLLREV
jgi:hypothetical protein